MTEKQANLAGLLLAGDIGGTKTNLGLFDIADGVSQPTRKGIFANDEYENLAEVLTEFLADQKRDLLGVSLAAAGPVIDERVELTNLDWELSAPALRKDLGLEQVWLLNDLQASAEAIPALADKDFKLLHAGKAKPDGVYALVAPGTGLGEAYSVQFKGERIAFASEGGHTDFGPRNQLQSELLAFLQEQWEHVSVERVCSGIGIPNLYAFLRQSGAAGESPGFAQRLASSEDPTATILEAAMQAEPECELCVQTLDLFLEILGAEASNCALKVGAEGGVFIGGGIPPRIISAFEKDIFLKAFFAKGRHRKYLEAIPVKVILNPESPLLGAALYGYRQCRETI